MFHLKSIKQYLLADKSLPTLINNVLHSDIHTEEFASFPPNLFIRNHLNIHLFNPLQTPANDGNKPSSHFKTQYMNLKPLGINSITFFYIICTVFPYSHEITKFHEHLQNIAIDIHLLVTSPVMNLTVTTISIYTNFSFRSNAIYNQTNS